MGRNDGEPFINKSSPATPEELTMNDIDQYDRETTMNKSPDENFEIAEKQNTPAETNYDTVVAKSEEDIKFCLAFNQLTGYVFVSPNKDMGENSLVIERGASQHVISELNDPAFRRQVQTLLEKMKNEMNKKTKTEALLSRLREQLKSTLEERLKILEQIRESNFSRSKNRQNGYVLLEQIKVYDKEISKIKKDIEKRSEINQNINQAIQAHVASIEELAIQLGEAIGLKRIRNGSIPNERANTEINGF